MIATVPVPYPTRESLSLADGVKRETYNQINYYTPIKETSECLSLYTRIKDKIITSYQAR